MKEPLQERQQRFSFRKLSVGLVSALVGTYMMTSPVISSVPVQAHMTEQGQSVCGREVQYQYLLEADLSKEERSLLVHALPGVASETDEIYYMIYRPKQVGKVAKILPKSGDEAHVTALLTGLGVGLVLLALKRRSKGAFDVKSLVILTSLGASVLTYDALADRTSTLSHFNQTLSVCVGDQLPAPLVIDGFEYVGYLTKATPSETVQSLVKSEQTKEVMQPVVNALLPEESLEVTKSSDRPPVVDLPSASIDKRQEVDKRVIPFTLEYVEDPNLPLGQEVVRQSGVNGSVSTTYEVTLVDGVEVSRQLVGTPVEIAPTNQLVVRGTFVEAVPSNAPVVEAKPIAEVSHHNDVVTTPIPFSLEYVEDPNLPLGQEVVRQSGVNGSVSTTYEVTLVDGVEVSRQLVGTPVEVAPTNQLVARGTFVEDVPSHAPMVEALPEADIAETSMTDVVTLNYDRLTQTDPSLPLGETRVQQVGQEGRLTITYAIVTVDGVEVSRQEISRQRVEPIAEIIAVGSFVEPPKPVVTTELITERQPVPFSTEYRDNADLALGQTSEVQSGRDGVRTLTYQVTKENGQEVKREQVGDEITTAPQPRIIERGTKVAPKPVVTTEVVDETLPFSTRRLEDNQLLKGTEVVEVQGQNGLIRKTYQVTTLDGQEVDRVLTQTERVEPTEQVMRVGTANPKADLDWTAVDALVAEAGAIRLSVRYVYDNQADQTAYDTEIERATAAKKAYLATTTSDLTQEQVNAMAAAIEERKRQLDGQKTKPQLTITKVVEDDLARQAKVSYQLTDPTQAYISAKAQLFDGDKLVREMALTDLSQPLVLTGLDYFKPYTLQTIMTYDLGQGEVSELIADTREIELEFKKIEFKDIDDVALYRYDAGRFIRQSALSAVPADLGNYVVKILSDRHKEVILPVSAITPTEVAGKQAYHVKVSFDELVQDTADIYDQAYDKDYILTLDHLTTSQGVYTSFKALVAAMTANPTGEFRLGADLSASEISVSDMDKAYVPADFRGKLYGTNDGRAFAIHDLKLPLFTSLTNARVANLDLKDVAINTKQSVIGALAKTANNASISDVAVSGQLTAVRELGGLLGMATETSLTDVHFQGNITATTTDSSGSATGGIVGLLEGQQGLIRNASADVDMLVQGGSGGFKTGAIAGVVRNGALVEKAYAKGSVTGRRSGQVAGMIGSTWQNGRAQQLLSDVKVTNGNTIHGDSDYKGANVREAYVSDLATGSKDQWTTVVTAEEAARRLSDMNLTATLADSGRSLVDNTYSVDYSKVAGAQSGREMAYANTETLLPFYNKEYIVHMGNKIDPTHKLYTTRLRDVVPMVGDKIVTDVATNKAEINRLMLHYADDTVAYLDLTFKEDFRNRRVADYSIVGTDLLYTPEVFLSTYDSLLAQVMPQLSAIAYDSLAVREVLNLPTDDANGKHLGYLYLSEAFADVKANLATQLRSLLAMDKAINTEGQVVEEALVKKITDNQAALLLGLTYLNRWYDIDFGHINTKALSTFKLDFFGKNDQSVLDMVIALGQSGYDNLVAKNNDRAYDNSLAQAKGIKGLFNYLEAYRHLFLPTKSNNEWLKTSSKAYIVESESLVDSVRDRQKAAYGQKNNKYSVGVYDKITSDNWAWKNMLLPLLTMTDESVYVISNMSTLSIGGYERYLYDKGSEDFIPYMRNKIDQVAIWQRDHHDFWYKVLSDQSKDKLFRTVLNYDGFNYRNNANNASWRTLLDTDKSIQQFFGPVSKYYRGNGSGAYADGSQTHFVVDRILDQYGTSVYTHEMVHNSDGGIYFEGLGRREGLGAELFALGLLQNPNSLGMQAITLNTYLTGSADSEERYHTANPVERFKNVQDLNTYVHGMYDVIYLLDYLEAQSLIKQEDRVKKDLLRRIENYYVTDRDGKQTHAGNRLARLTDGEIAKLTSLDALIDGNILTRRSYGDTNEFGRNGYYTISMFSPIYAALHNPTGAPGDIMFRRMAYELLAAKGYHDGFLPYVSNQYGEQALKAGSQTWSGWHRRYVGLVTDDIVFKNVFGNEYGSWAEFKKAMYQERIAKLDALKPITITYKLGQVNAQDQVTISSYADLQRLMDEAMAYDARQLNNAIHSSYSWVYKLKEKVYNAYIRQTDDFRTSIFE